ncbi:4-hydroxybenzoate transporter [Cupriavidus oxalaticus]|uniref:MFS transporter n=1 Tax=Cupriavidus oxalaticus TaxID=96344 RepID=UPI003F733317
MAADREAVIDVQEFIDSRSFSPFQWGILILCFLIVAADGFDTAAIGFVAPALTSEWSVSKIDLGPVLSAALIGLAIGALVAGPTADRYGRKRVLLLSVVAFGALSLACAYASSLNELLVLRFLTGVGLGAAMPNATTLLSEYAPASRRGFLVNVMFCGFTLGAAGGGLAAAALIPEFGWRSVFIVGGIAPLLLAFALLALPESVRYMVVKNKSPAAIRTVLERIGGKGTASADRFVLPEQDSQRTTSPVSIVLSQQLRFGTLMLWVTYFMGLLVYYLLSSWMPTLIRESGLSIRDASLITALFPFGSTVGAIICGWLMDRRNPYKVVGIAYLLTGAFVWAIGQSLGDTALLIAVTFLAGIFMGGGQVSMPVLASTYYPTAGRASGVAWMLGVGRFGGILGAFIGGTLLQLGLSLPTILGILAIPAAIAALSIMAMGSSEMNIAVKDARSEAI